MERLANGALDTEIPGTERRDEIGGMAGAVLVFKEHMQRAQDTDRRTRTGAGAGRREPSRRHWSAMAETIESEARQALAEIGRRTRRDDRRQPTA